MIKQFIRTSWPSLLLLASGIHFLVSYGGGGDFGGFLGVSMGYPGVFIADLIFTTIGGLMTANQVRWLVRQRRRNRGGLESDAD